MHGLVSSFIVICIFQSEIECKMPGNTDLQKLTEEPYCDFLTLSEKDPHIFPKVFVVKRR